VIGARRGRQGLGEFLARFAVRHGATVPAFLGRSPQTVEEARLSLAGHGILARGYTNVNHLLADQLLDGLIVASPAGTHLEYLDRALGMGLHVLCEKPMVWGQDDPVAEAERIEQAFAEQGIALWENCQWPGTLSAFRDLHPEAPAEPERFSMWLGPTSRGRQMLVDSMSHPLSLLQALLPGAASVLADVEFSTLDPGAGTLEVRFRVLRDDGAVLVHVELRSTPEQPRPAGYALDGFRAERRVRMDDGYALSFEDGGRSVPVPDPMERLVADFVGAISGRTPAPGPANTGLARRVAWLDTLITTYDGAAARG
jgi:predicted dehydrogenase